MLAFAPRQVRAGGIEAPGNRVDEFWRSARRHRARMQPTSIRGSP